MKRNPIILAKTSPRLQEMATSETFRVGVRAQADELELLIHGVIGDPWDELDSLSMAKVLAENRGKTVNARINSGGGLAWDGIAIYNELVQHDAAVNITIEGMAGSAASVIAMAGDTIRIAENGQFFIHRAWGLAMGNQADIHDYAEFLAGIDRSIAATYTARTGLERQQVEEWMIGKVDGTTFSGPEAVEHGFADEVIPLKKKYKDDEENHDARKAVAMEMEREQAARQRRILAARAKEVEARLAVVEK